MKASGLMRLIPATVKTFPGRVPVLVPAVEDTWMRPVEIRRYLRSLREVRQYRSNGDFYYY